MAAVSVLRAPAGGFSFDNCARNSLLEAELAQKGLRVPAPRKTGTTIAGVIFKDGVVLGADTRATEGMVVADKNCSKIHFISPNIYCCGAGTAADTEMTTQLISSNLELHSLSTGRLPRVVTANRMLKQMLFRYQGYIGAALVLGGVDVTGPHLYSIHPHGSTDKLPYVTMGSGSLAAMAVFEDKYKPDMESRTENATKSLHMLLIFVMQLLWVLSSPEVHCGFSLLCDCALGMCAIHENMDCKSLEAAAPAQ
ncbi:proteasome subunit beta type-7 isoform X2 [Haemorhous mexicanus]|uniref:proteasome subunit beta type-7 isoform X2 n=1 Tax=Haemorhous mexicanus TaxID=30427 RepID=UPI0028BDDE9B|nr:proteasome subunit beta type-7 isoform X2 [Haemorhous mexicanus]